MITLKEMVDSSTAKKLKINNTPSSSAFPNICDMLTVMNTVRCVYGSPIYITSGYRCKELNKAVGGVLNSAHLDGRAVDIQIRSNKFSDWEKVSDLFLKYSNMIGKKVTVIYEKPKNGLPTWLHLEHSNKDKNSKFTLS